MSLSMHQQVLESRKSTSWDHSSSLTARVCFQVPAVTIEHGITIVIVPIIGKLQGASRGIKADHTALMHDQVSSLQERGIQAASLCSTTQPSAVAEVSSMFRAES